MREDTGRLLEEIAHCPVVVSCRSGADHPCSRVVDVQRDVGLEHHQVPEPWSGHLEDALVLFIGTSPAIARGEDYVVWSDAAEAVAGYFEDRFGPGPRQIRDGVYPPIPGRHSSTPLQSWVEVRSRAAELVDDPVPGLDYAVTYAVHCRTEGELGVRRAMTACPERYLRRLVAAARRARVLVALGPHAAAAVHDALGVDVGNAARHAGPLPVGGRDRHVVYLDHFGGYGAVKEVAAAVDADTLALIRAELAAARSDPDVSSPRGGPPSDDPLSQLRRAFRDLAGSFDAGEVGWLARSGRLTDTVLSRAGWLLQRSSAGQGSEVLVLNDPAGLVVGNAGRTVVCCDYAVASAYDCLRPDGCRRAVDWALQRTSAGEAVAAAALAVPAPVSGDGSFDGGALDEVAQVLTPAMRLRAPVERHRLHENAPQGQVPCLDIYLVGPGLPG